MLQGLAKNQTNVTIWRITNNVMSNFFPHSSNLVKIKKTLGTKFSHAVEQFAMPLALYGSLATVPQVYEVLVKRQTSGVSVLTFILFLTGNLFWFSYGMIHKDKPIMASHLTTGILNFMIIAGVLLIR